MFVNVAKLNNIRDLVWVSVGEMMSLFSFLAVQWDRISLLK